VPPVSLTCESATAKSKSSSHILARQRGSLASSRTPQEALERSASQGQELGLGGSPELARGGMRSATGTERKRSGALVREILRSGSASLQATVDEQRKLLTLRIRFEVDSDGDTFADVVQADPTRNVQVS